MKTLLLTITLAALVAGPPPVKNDDTMTLRIPTPGKPGQILKYMDGRMEWADPPKSPCPHDGEESEELGPLVVLKEDPSLGLKHVYGDARVTVMLCPNGHLWARKAKP